MNAKMPLFNMTVGAFLARLALLLLVIIWLIPTLGLLISSFRSRDAISTSGWWTALASSTQTDAYRPSGDMVETGGEFVLEGTILDGSVANLPNSASIKAYGTSANSPGEFAPGETAPLNDEGATVTVNADGSYVLRSPVDLERLPRLALTASVPPHFTVHNYEGILVAPEGSDRNVWQAFVNTFTVTIPATIIPIAIALFAAYAFSWMQFPGRMVLFAIVVGLLVVPLQMSLIPLLRLYVSTSGVWNQMIVDPVNGMVGSQMLDNLPAKSYPGIWLAHTGFGLPFAIFLLRNYIGGLPGDIIESAQIDGASHFTIFTRLILPLSVPAIAAFAIFQFLWVWNDLLVALVFLTKDPNQIVLTSRLREFLGSRGGDWDILSSSAFVSIVVPLTVFFALQRYFVRGLLAGSVKGG